MKELCIKLVIETSLLLLLVHGYTKNASLKNVGPFINKFFVQGFSRIEK